MSAQNAETPLAAPPKPLSGFRAALRYTGLPVFLFDKKPKLPSRNWLIFLSLTSTVAGYYIYDRRQCKSIKQHYIDLVKDHAEELVSPLDWSRKVTVYGAKWPGDEDYDQAIKYFRKYVKPILVAAAVDFEMISGKRHGDLVERVADDIRQRRRLELGIDPIPEIAKALPTYKSPTEVAQHKFNGGIVLVGRPTLKEFMAGLKKGWTDGLEKVDHEEILAQQLELDSHFDEPELPSDDMQSFPDKKPTVQTPQSFSPFQVLSSPASLRAPKATIPDSMNVTPATIPPVPPLLLVPFTNHIGFTQIPIMIWEWFNQRHKVRSGAEAGYRLVMMHKRPVVPPSGHLQVAFGDETNPYVPANQGDLDFDKEAESWYKKSLAKISSEIDKARDKYYKELPAKLTIARELARGTREPTKEETNNPPPTEVELRAERMKKELRWRRDLAGWDIVKPSSRVAWDDRFEESLFIFIDRKDDSFSSS